MTKTRCKLKKEKKKKVINLDAYICSKCALTANEKNELCKPDKK